MKGKNEKHTTELKIKIFYYKTYNKRGIVPRPSYTIQQYNYIQLEQ